MDAHKSVQVLLCMSVDHKDDVDRICTVASGNGGKIDPTILKQMDGMYGRSFEDPDGHVCLPFFTSLPPQISSTTYLTLLPKLDGRDDEVLGVR